MANDPPSPSGDAAYWAVNPPSIGRQTPLIMDAPSPSRNTIGAAI